MNDLTKFAVAGVLTMGFGFLPMVLAGYKQRTRLLLFGYFLSLMVIPFFVNESFSPVVEINGYHTLNEGDNTPLPFNGLDVANLGGGEGEDAISIGLGGEFRPAEGVALRAAWEGPLTDNDDLWGSRITLSAIWSF